MTKITRCNFWSYCSRTSTTYIMRFRRPHSTLHRLQGLTPKVTRRTARCMATRISIEFPHGMPTHISRARQTIRMEKHTKWITDFAMFRFYLKFTAVFLGRIDRHWIIHMWIGIASNQVWKKEAAHISENTILRIIGARRKAINRLIYFSMIMRARKYKNKTIIIIIMLQQIENPIKLHNNKAAPCGVRPIHSPPSDWRVRGGSGCRHRHRHPRYTSHFYSHSCAYCDLFCFFLQLETGSTAAGPFSVYVFFGRSFPQFYISSILRCVFVFERKQCIVIVVCVCVRARVYPNTEATTMQKRRTQARISLVRIAMPHREGHKCQRL